LEAKAVTDVVWRKGDFEERGIDPRMFASGTANTWIVENSLPNPGLTDFFWIEPGGNIVIVEAKVDPQRAEKFVTTWRWRNPHRPDRDKFVSSHWHADAPLNDAIVFSRLLIDEPPPQIQSNSAVSSWEIDQPQQELAAIHPVTKAAYDQLTNIPGPYREAIARLLNQFANFVPQTEPSKFPHLRLAALEDSSYLLEWTLRDRRLGFSFEPDAKESGWYYVYSSGSSERYESGSMDQLEMARLIAMTLKD
jgi:hypothetical protein